MMAMAEGPPLLWFMPCVSRPHLDVGSGAPGYFETGPMGWVSGTWRNPAGMGTVSLAWFCAVGGSQVMSASCQGAGLPGAGRITTRTGRYVPGLTQMVAEILLSRPVSSMASTLSASHAQVYAGDRGPQGPGHARRQRAPAAVRIG